MIQLGKEMDNKILDNLALRVNEYFLKMLRLYFVRRYLLEVESNLTVIEIGKQC